MARSAKKKKKEETPAKGDAPVRARARRKRRQTEIDVAEEDVVDSEEAIVPDAIGESRLLDEVAAVVVLTGAVFTTLSFVAYQRGNGGLNIAGKVGEVLADALVQALGFAAYLGPLFLTVIGLLLFRQASREISLVRSLAAVIAVVCAAVFLGLIASPGREVALAGGSDWRIHCPDPRAGIRCSWCVSHRYGADGVVPSDDAPDVS